MGGNTKFIAKDKVSRGELGFGDIEFRSIRKAEQREHIRVASFDQRAGGVADDPLSGGYIVSLPAFAGFNHKFWVVFGDVVEVVGNGSAHVVGWIILEIFQKGDDGAGGIDVLRELFSPREEDTP